MLLDVYVRGAKVGVLEQTGITSFVFSYLPDVPVHRAVSLLMPPRTKSWESPFLFPIFQVSLPEGALRQTLEQSFAKHFDRFDDMALLSIVGESLIGQIQVVPPGQSPKQRTMQQSLESLFSEDLKPEDGFCAGSSPRLYTACCGGFSLSSTSWIICRCTTQTAPVLCRLAPSWLLESGLYGVPHGKDQTDQERC